MKWRPNVMASAAMPHRRILAVALLKEDETRIASCIGVVEHLHVGMKLQQT